MSTEARLLTNILEELKTMRLLAQKTEQRNFPEKVDVIHNVDPRYPPRPVMKVGEMAIMANSLDPDDLVKILGNDPYSGSQNKGDCPRYWVRVCSTKATVTPWQTSVFPVVTISDMVTLYGRVALGECRICSKVVWEPLYSGDHPFDYRQEVVHYSCHTMLQGL